MVVAAVKADPAVVLQLAVATIPADLAVGLVLLVLPALAASQANNIRCRRWWWWDNLLHTGISKRDVIICITQPTDLAALLDVIVATTNTDLAVLFDLVVATVIANNT